MIKINFAEKLDQAEDITEIFSIVKDVVRKITGRERSGLMLGLAELGGQPGFFVGAFYPVGSNMIIMNKTPMRAVGALKPNLFKSYCFHILLHEYLHTLGILNERENRIATVVIAERAFGPYHPVALISKDFNRVFPEVMLSTMNWRPVQESPIEIVEGFDKDSTSYIG